MESNRTIPFRDLKRREIICLQNGNKIGFADDILLDVREAKVVSLVVYGSAGLWSEREDLYIPWEELKLIGADTILVGQVNGVKQKTASGLFRLLGRLTAFWKKDG